jgi:anti-sigma factor RsiW
LQKHGAGIFSDREWIKVFRQRVSMTTTNDKQTRDPGELLPWYLNGSLSPGERAEVEAWLHENPEGEAELELLRRMQDQVVVEAESVSPGELGLKRLKRGIRQETKAEIPRKQLLPVWWRPMMAAALAVIVVQGLLLAGLGQQGIDPGIRPLSAPAYAEPLLQVRFRPEATESRIREVLLNADAVLVDGPSAAGIYRLRASDGSQEGLARTEGVLRSHPDIVIHLARE